MGLLAGTLGVAGCSQGDKAQQEPMPMEQTVFGEQVKQLQKAEDQAREMEGRMDDLNRRLEDAGE